MAQVELVSGDFEKETVRLRYSEAGRAFLRLRSVDGMVEDVFLETDVAGVAESGEGRVGEYLERWAERDGFCVKSQKTKVASDRSRQGEGRGERIFVLLMRDGRKFVARGSADAVAEIKAATVPANRRVKLARLDEARRTATTGFLPRALPGFIARLLPSR